MKFYFRTEVLNELNTLWGQARVSSKMMVIMGRRRVGKTSVALEFVKDKKFLYLFAAKKAEALLCPDYVEVIERELNIKVHGKIETFKEIFSLLMEHAKQHHFVLIIDEFQEFFNINPSVYSDLQCIWDLNKNTTKMELIFIGSINTLMHKIFEDAKEPLFGRADRMITLKPFTIPQMSKILKDYKITDLQSLFDFYVITGGVPKYLDILLNNNCKTLDDMLDFMVRENSPFLSEGRNQLITEFGKEYMIYFSVLELISSGKTSSSEIESIIHKNVSAYLDKLDSTYSVIQKVKPLDAKPNSKLQKYQFIDNFLQFWFRFFHRNRDAIEIRNFDFIKKLIKRFYDSYKGRLLEKFFYDLLALTGKYNRIACYWEKRHVNEIDLVAVNDLEKILLLAEVKMNKLKNSAVRLEHRAINLISRYPDYTVEYKLLSLEDAQSYLDEL